MNDTHSFEEIQYCPDNPDEFLIYFNDFLRKIHAKTEECIQQAETELWLCLRKAVIHSFQENTDLERADIVHLLSTTLLDMDAAFHALQEKRCEVR